MLASEIRLAKKQGSPCPEEIKRICLLKAVSSPTSFLSPAEKLFLYQMTWWLTSSFLPSQYDFHLRFLGARMLACLGAGVVEASSNSHSYGPLPQNRLSDPVWVFVDLPVAQEW